MIKSALKSFFRNLKYYFTPLGVLFLFLLIGLAVAVPVALSAAGDLTASVRGVIAEAEIDPAVFRDLFLTEIDKLPPSFAAAAEHVLTTSWLEDTLHGLLTGLTQEANVYLEGISASVSVFFGELLVSIAVVILFFGFGLAAGLWVTRFLVRREIARRSIWRAILAAVVHAVLVVIVVIAAGILFLVWTPGGIILTVLVLLLSGFIGLVEAYFVHGRGKVPFRRVVSVKNIAGLYVGYILVLAIAVAAAALLVWLAGSLIGGVIAAPVFIIAVIVNGMSDEAYVRSLAEKAGSAPAAAEKES